MDIFEKLEYKNAFEKFREIPSHFFSEYFNLLEIGEGRKIITDLGAGPGLQSLKLINNIPNNWHIHIVEPSKELISSAEVRLRRYSDRITFKNISLAELQMFNQIDIIWISEVAHVLGDPFVWVKKLSEILNKNGQIIIRTSTHEQLLTRMWYDFFPTARKIDIERHPDQSILEDSFKYFEFSYYTKKVVDESRQMNPKLLYNMLLNKCFSTLHKIPQKEFENGIRELKSYLNDKKTILWDYKMTAYYAKK